MTRTLEVQDGHTYLVTTNDQGEVVSREGRDELPQVPTRAIRTKVRNLIDTPAPWTNTQISNGLRLILALLMDLPDA